MNSFSVPNYIVLRGGGIIEYCWWMLKKAWLCLPFRWSKQRWQICTQCSMPVDPTLTMWHVLWIKDRSSLMWDCYIILIIMYTYHAFINALSAHMIHTNLNTIFYTHARDSRTKTIYIRHYMKTCYFLYCHRVLCFCTVKLDVWGVY